MIARLLRLLKPRVDPAEQRRRDACARLERMVAERRESFEIQSFRKNRAAQKGRVGC